VSDHDGLDLARDQPAIDLLAAYGELQQLLISSPDMAAFLDELAVLAVGVLAPAASCGITLRRDHQLFTAAASSQLASQVDELQYGRGVGPCLQALHTGQIVVVPDLAADDRWGDYRLHAIAHGVAASISLPLTTDASTIGAINLYATSAHQFTETEVDRVTAFARQASGAVSLVLRQADQSRLHGQFREALAARAIIDQALGLIMGQRRCTAGEAFTVLREASQNRNVKLAAVAADLIVTATGHPPEPPRPFGDGR
jgi:GAF domain-containing protein